MPAVLCRDNYIDFARPVKTYIRDCYYRIMTELLMFVNSPVDFPRLLVLGNPGVGKSMLSFLFLRVLLELGTQVRCAPRSSRSFFLLLFPFSFFPPRRLSTRM
jgi:hypothetical protein